MQLHPLLIVALVVALFAAAPVAGDYKPAEGPLMTRWAKEVSPDNALPEYPRPQMVREKWQNLNGLWQYAIRPRDEGKPEKWDGEILVPFAVESALSGVMKPVGPDNKLWYRRTFTLSNELDYPRLLLHFEAVDWHATVWVNGKKVGEHKGGYAPFSFDVTDAIGHKPVSLPGQKKKEHEIVVSVYDSTDTRWQPRGKQVREPRGIWYTSVTGIWGTVWLESVNSMRIDKLKLVPDVDGGQLRVQANVTGADESGFVQVIARDGDRTVANVKQTFEKQEADKPAELTLALPIKDAKLWSPDKPFLYDLEARVYVGPQMQVDGVDSYFAMRKIEVRKDPIDGFNRLFLNNEPVFQYGPLDQGWWPDGLYTAPTDEALKYDIEVTKKLGFNMARKHVKVEPRRWYYWTDKLGLLVWQDMPNGDRHIGSNDPDIRRSPESEENFRREWREIIDTLHNHPSIVAWVPFNEGWGQFKTNEILKWTKQLDPTRLVDGPSGWTDRGEGDMHDMHRYPGPAMPQPEANRAVVLGEFGGLGLPVEGHLWWNKRNWGYRTYDTKEELRRQYDLLIHRLRPLIGQGLAAAIYTQTTDVEGEVNGLMTYDRAVIKFDPAHMRKLHARLYEPPGVIERTVVVPTSETQPQTWAYTTEKPADDWFKPGFDDSKWTKNPGGFGEPTTPGSVVRTRWKTDDIWLRRTFTLDEVNTEDLHLRIHHDEDTQVYINGKKVLEIGGYSTEYIELPLLGDDAKALKKGENVIAVHTKQTGGGQYIDVGITRLTEKPREKKQSRIDPDAPRPNIVIVMLDDMGWSDLGCYGGEVQTPHIDSLASNGLRFTQFYNTSRCCPTRASLLTGLYPHQTGVGAMTFDTGKPGYRGYLQRNCVTLAEALRPAGYRTAMVGKWHLSLTQSPENHMAWLNRQAMFDRPFSDVATYPVNRGFEQHYGIIWGVVNFFDPFSLVHNETPIKTVPEDYYITDALNEHAVKVVEQYSGGDKPFFLYLAHAAPHWPLHAKPEDIEKYKDTYTIGWDAVRKARYERQVKMGLIEPDSAVLTPSVGDEQTWADEKHQAWEARCMAVHAAMIDRVDQGIGQLIAKLKETGEYDNTLIFVLSDNGASPERPGRPGFDRTSETRDGRPVRYYNQPKDKDVMPGAETTYAGIGRMWANASNTPYRYWKAQPFEGGICTPLIAHWPAGLKAEAGSITRQPGHIIDLMPTCLEVAGASYPSYYHVHEITPVEGKSLTPILRGERREGHAAIYFEHQGGRAVRVDDLKLVARRGQPWELYDLSSDRTEMRDLAKQRPDKVKELAAKWDAWAQRVNAAR